MRYEITLSQNRQYWILYQIEDGDDIWIKSGTLRECADKLLELQPDGKPLCNVTIPLP
jgi:hypothetical protein